MLSLAEHLNVSKQRVTSRKEIKALRTKAAAEQRVKLAKKTPEQLEKDINNQRLSRVDFRISADESAYSVLNTNIAKNNTHTEKSERNIRMGGISFEEKINRDARNYEVSENYLL